MKAKSGHFATVVVAMLCYFMMRSAQPEMPQWEGAQLIFLIVISVGVWRKE